MVAITRRVLSVGLAVGSAACATTTAPEAAPALDQRLAPLARFVGHWRGTARGEPGTGIVQRSYTPILAGKFMEERNQSSYDSGEVHHHLGFWSFDRGRSRFVFRQFHQESFVNQFVASTPDFVGDQLVVDSEAIENIPAGFRARETYRFNGPDAFEEIFEIAEPGGELGIYSHNVFGRV